MANPTPYKPHFNYSGWEQDSPAEPKPGAEIDVDLADISRSINETINALKDVRRSDGKIQNRAVDFDALSPAVKAALANSDFDYEVIEDLLAKDANLSDLTNLKEARSNLGTFSTVADVQSRNIPPVLDSIRTEGYYTPGDGGGALYKRVASEPSHAGKIQSADGAWWEIDTNSPANVLMFGARENATAAVNTAAFQTAIDVMQVRGGGEVQVPTGTYTLGQSQLGEVYDNNGSPSLSDKGCLVLRSGVTLRGAGQGVTILKPEDSHHNVIFLTTPENVGIFDLTIDGGWGGESTSGHGIFQVRESNPGPNYVRDVIINNVCIRNVSAYGIGIQNGDVERLFFSNIVIENTGADGMDLKARPDVTRHHGIFLDNIYVRRFGMRHNLDGPAGIDVQCGYTSLSNIHVEILKGDDDPPGKIRTGIRFHSGALANRESGAESRLTNFRVSSDYGDDTCYGLDVKSPDVVVDDGVIVGTRVGVAMLAPGESPGRSVISNVLVRDAAYRGFWSRSSKSTFLNCHVDGAERAFDFDDPESHHATILGGSIANSDIGLRLRSTEAFVVGLRMLENVSTPIDSNSNTNRVVAFHDNPDSPFAFNDVLGGLGGLTTAPDADDLNNLSESFTRFWNIGTDSPNAPSVSRYQGIHIQRTGGGGEVQFALAEGGNQRSFYRSRGSSTWNPWIEFLSTNNTTVDTNGFIKEASPIVRLFDDRAEEPVSPVDAVFTKISTGHYTLSSVPQLASTGWQIETPQDGQGNRLLWVETSYADDTLTIHTSEPQWNGAWEAGAPKDIPDGRWVDLRFERLEDEVEDE